MGINIKQKIKNILPSQIWDFGHLIVAVLGAIVFRFPSRGMMVIGVTGTNGKSTVVEILHKTFQDFGLRVASVSSLRWRIRNERTENRLKMTMPGRFFLQRFLYQAKNKGCQVAIIEVTSEGTKQHRHVGINFDAAVFTNLKPEHIESHGSFEAYRDAKGRLFKTLAKRKGNFKTKSIINLDDPSAFFYSHFKADEKFGYGLLKENSRADTESIIPEEIKFSANNTSFTLGGLEWKSNLIGDFNLYNMLAAIATAYSFKVPLENIRKSVKDLRGIPGRLEVVQEKPFRVVVDYAHTPDALEAIYRIARSFWVGPKSKLIAVLGSAGGGRDKWKRPELGRIVDRFADKIILTNEDPYWEDPGNILKDIEVGIKSTKHEIIIDREEAIAKALASAKEGDAVVITGKGAEKMIMAKEGPVKWDDRKVVKAQLKKIDGKKKK